jgi:ribose transport system ATP-binding protein
LGGIIINGFSRYKNAEPVLVMSKINKQFPGVHALKDVDFELYEGQICGLVGENGAGKSTLMNVLGAVIQPDSGEVKINGRAEIIETSKQAEELGISFIHQELSLFKEMDVATNIFIQHIPKKAGLLDVKKLNDETKKILSAIHLDYIKPNTIVKNLKIGEQQLVEIGRALVQNTKILILDEPTSSLTRPEIDILFNIVEELKKKGVAVVFITHRLDEIFEICDTITIMRDGQKILSADIDSIERGEVVKNMIGRSVDEFYQHTKHAKGDELVALKNIRSKNKLSGVSLEVHKGEVVGVYGLLGSGRSETLRVLFGLHAITSGEIYVKKEKTEIKNPEQAMSRGIAFVTEDRRREGLVLGQSVKNNLVMASLSSIRKGLSIDYAKENQICEENIVSMKIKTPSLKRYVRFLSGGNQQKVVIAKWLNIKPELLMLDEPTRGIDVGAKHEIYTLVDDFVQREMGVLIVSSDLPEIMGMCDRVIVLKEGAVVADLLAEDMTKEALLSAAMGA